MGTKYSNFSAYNLPQVWFLAIFAIFPADYDLTGQLVWPGAELLNNYLSNNKQILHGRSIIELGSGVGVTGILCSRFCREIVLTDHNDEVIKVLKKNIDVHSSGTVSHADSFAEKLEWGNNSQLKEILQRHPGGFDLILGADICFQHSSIPLLFDTVVQLLLFKGRGCKFLLAYVSRARTLDELVIEEATQHGLQVSEVQGTRSKVGNHEGVIFEFTIQRTM
ncbi:protein N-terminal and lysine N-methyltransferase EFM7 isoform X2 [Nymphaea colorata]|uniref:protein N-terminal and lysine N-methyltransferase EFM7 isoform X2 n=1 Tax=Nymphaea colorata TaxID=210225 RepID=UPI00129DFA7A|nr:protein N-terminal and lysine N-methyltransferase EFM7 isoform X2 [Nymphaea colorata]